MALTVKERAARKRGVCAASGRKLFRGSVEFWPEEHELMCCLAKIIQSRRIDGDQGSLKDIKKFLNGACVARNDGAQ